MTKAVSSKPPAVRDLHAQRLDAKAQMLWQKLPSIEYRSPNDLVAYARKLRRYPERLIVQLMASIRVYGFIKPVLVDTDGTIIAGAACVVAARRLELIEIPTLRLEHLTPAQVKAYRIADNKLGSLSSFDEAILLVELEEIVALGAVPIESLGFITAEIDALNVTMGTQADEDPLDELPKPPAIPVSRAGDLWLLGDHRLICGSSLEPPVWARLMNGATAIMAFSDPPYGCPILGHVSGLGKVKHSEFAMGCADMSADEFASFCERWLEALVEHLADGSILHICMDWRKLYELMGACRKVGLTLINLCVWNKQNGGLGSLYRSKHELILVLKKGKAPHINNVELGKWGRYRCNVFEGYPSANSFGASRMQDLADHPTVKPTSLVADAIRDVSNHGDIVLDAFMGSGTTILAAERSGRIAYGVEIEPRFIDVALRRWSQITDCEPILEETGETFAQVAVRRSREADASPLCVAIDPPARRRCAA